jgi:hypothetical protein
MPIIRKVAPEIAATWDEPRVDEPVPIPTDSRGLTRMNYPASGSIGWMARVYYAGATFTRYFADARYGGPGGALRRAEIWRAEMRQRVAQRPTQAQPDSVRLVRVDRPDQKLVGWYVYVCAAGRRNRRYVSDARHGGAAAARQVGEQWAAELLKHADE